jgi:hypothetical protein
MSKKYTRLNLWLRKLPNLYIRKYIASRKKGGKSVKETRE